jgi:hypothetical protein
MRTPRPPFFKEPPIGDHVDPGTRKLILEIRESARSQFWGFVLITLALNIPLYLVLLKT